jgi:hypothetical protein
MRELGLRVGGKGVDGEGTDGVGLSGGDWEEGHDGREVDGRVGATRFFIILLRVIFASVSS